MLQIATERVKKVHGTVKKAVKYLDKATEIATRDRPPPLPRVTLSGNKVRDLEEENSNLREAVKQWENVMKDVLGQVEHAKEALSRENVKK